MCGTAGWYLRGTALLLQVPGLDASRGLAASSIQHCALLVPGVHCGVCSCAPKGGLSNWDSLRACKQVASALIM